MATKTVVLCDVHLADGEEVEGDAVVFAYRASGPRVLELCTECEDSLFAEVRDAIEQYKPRRHDPARDKVKAAPAHMAADDAETEATLVCDECGKTYRYRKALNDHRRKQHGLLNERYLDASALSSPCPFCENVSSAPQGLGAHVRAAHKDRYDEFKAAGGALLYKGKTRDEVPLV